MGYMHIRNLYSDQTVLQFPDLFALEKVHGTSASLTYRGVGTAVDDGPRAVISAMIEDVEREAEGEIIPSNTARAEIGKATGKLLKQYFAEQLKETTNEI